MFYAAHAIIIGLISALKTTIVRWDQNIVFWLIIKSVLSFFVNMMPPGETIVQLNIDEWFF